MDAAEAKHEPGTEPEADAGAPPPRKRRKTDADHGERSPDAREAWNPWDALPDEMACEILPPRDRAGTRRRGRGLPVHLPLCWRHCDDARTIQRRLDDDAEAKVYRAVCRAVCRRWCGLVAFLDRRDAIGTTTTTTEARADTGTDDAGPREPGDRSSGGGLGGDGDADDDDCRARPRRGTARRARAACGNYATRGSRGPPRRGDGRAPRPPVAADVVARSGGARGTNSGAGAAAGMGHLGLLRWARERGCPWDESAPARTRRATAGSAALRWARENGCPWDA